MKKQHARLLASLLAATTILSACGGTATPASPSASSESAVASTSASASASSEASAPADERKMEGNLYVEGFPVVKEPETFTFLVDDGGQPADKFLVPKIEEATNVKVEWLVFPYEIAKEKKNIMINSGDYPDVIGGWLLSENEILNYGPGDGLFVPIEDAIAKYSPNMTAALDMPSVRQTMTLPDGHIYTVPYVLPTPKVAFNPYINKAWMQKLGLSMPTNTDELIAVLKAFRDKDPNGNGQKDEIAWSGDNHNGYLGLFAGWWGTPVPKGNFTYLNGKFEFTANTEAFKQAIKFFAQLNKEGLLDPEFFTQNSDQWKAKGKKDLYGACVGYGHGDWAPDGYQIIKGTELYDPLPVLKGAGATADPKWYANSAGTYIFKTQVAITDKAKNVNTIVRWFDYALSEEFSVARDNGWLDVTYKKVADNTYERLDTTSWNEADKKKVEWGNLFFQSLPKFIPFNTKFLPAPGSPEEYKEKDLVDQMYGPSLIEPDPQVWANEADAKRVSVLQTDLDKYVDDKIATWVSGQADIDAEWDAYLAQLEKLGMQELTTLKNKPLGK